MKMDFHSSVRFIWVGWITINLNTWNLISPTKIKTTKTSLKFTFLTIPLSPKEKNKNKDKSWNNKFCGETTKSRINWCWKQAKDNVLYVQWNCHFLCKNQLLYSSSVVQRKFTCVISEVWGKNILDFLCFMDSYRAFSTASWVDKANEIENEMPDSYFLKI